jgi:hypothetical protein
MAQRLVLHPAPDLVEAAVPGAHHVEGIGHPPGVVEVRRQYRSERLGQVGGHHLDAAQPRRIGLGRPSPQVSGPIALDHVDDHLGLEVHQPGGVHGGVATVGGQERGLVDAELGHRTDAAGVVHQRGAVFVTAFITVHQHTPNSAATVDTGRASSPTWRQASAPARRVSTTWASTCSEPSVQVLASQCARHSATGA